MTDENLSAEEEGRLTGKPASQVEAERHELTEQEKTEIEARTPGGVNEVPSDPRDSEAEREAGGPPEPPAEAEQEGQQ